MKQNETSFNLNYGYHSKPYNPNLQIHIQRTNLTHLSVMTISIQFYKT